MTPGESGLTRSPLTAVPEAAESLDRLVRLALAEDVGPGDWTTAWTVDPETVGCARAVAGHELVVGGTAVACAVFAAVDPELAVRVVRGDGIRVAAGDVVLEASGREGRILTAERIALNFLGRLSGIASLARAFVDAVRGTPARILDTRKTTPGWRHLEKAAVRAGGADNHRMGLYDMIMIKDNHIAAAGGITRAVERVRRQGCGRLPIEVEVTHVGQLEEALGLGVDRIMLDNMTLDEMEKAVARVHRLGSERPEIEASGNVTLASVRAVAETGVDQISVGALTHSAPVADFALRMY